jgi:hypothetical protein
MALSGAAIEKEVGDPGFGEQAITRDMPPVGRARSETGSCEALMSKARSTTE